MRVRNWDVALVRWQSDVLGQPFRWGETDCASLVVAALEVMYPDGEFPLPHDRPSYDDETGALQAYAETGGVAAVLERGGAETAPLAFARQGDILVGVGEAGGMEGAAVVVEDHYVVASEDEGVIRRRLRHLRASDPGGVTVWRPPNE